jgi:hypothetical protein
MDAQNNAVYRPTTPMTFDMPCVCPNLPPHFDRFFLKVR